MTPGLHAHVPTPGDHYSPATGSAAMTVIYELSRHHMAAGGQSQVVVSAGTRHDYPVGECIEVAGPPLLPPRWAQAGDLALARVGLPRRWMVEAYRPACRGVDPSAQWAFLHNAPAALRALAGVHPTVPRALYVHNELFRTYSDREMDRAVSAADRVICVSGFMAARVGERAARHSDKIRVVLNGVDTDAFSPPEVAPDPELPVILFVGRVTPEKGADVLLRAAAPLAGRKQPFRIRIVGSQGFARDATLSPYERSLRELAQPLGDAVEFVPFTDRKAVVRLYQSASIHCVPSNWDEPVSLTTLEGMATGLPVVAARRGGIPEVGGTAAHYFDPADPSTLTELLAWLLDDPAARSELGAQSRAWALQLNWAHRYRTFVDALER
jgi:glycosyltransferase involved in cell wall biosynthesis